MNRLKPAKQVAIVSGLVEGLSIRSVERMTGVHRDTIMRLAVRVGTACEKALDATLRGLTCEHVELDEIWCYVAKKQRHVREDDNKRVVGDFWTWVAIDADTKLVPTYMVGKRDAPHAHLFLADLASRLKNRPLISSDGLGLYVQAVS